MKISQIIATTLIVLLLKVCGNVHSQNNDEKIINPPGCGKRLADFETLKIIGGTEARVGDFNWQIALIIYSSFSCSASLINSRWALTAAHCLDGVAYVTFIRPSKLYEFNFLFFYHLK